VRRPHPSSALVSAPRAWALATLAALVACSPRPEGSPDEPPGDAVAAAPASPAPAAPTEAAPEAQSPAEAIPASTAEPKTNPSKAEAEAELDPLAPLPEAVVERFENLPRDPKPDSLIRNSHYWISNEVNQQIWYDHVVDKGGAYLGVGTDQNYLLAGWAKSDLVVVVDFDIYIVDLHRVYALFFEQAETFEDFLLRWSPDREAEGLALIDERYADRPDYDRIRKAYKVARQLVWARLRNVRRAYEERDIPTFISDQEQYDHVRTLSRNGRVFAVRGDFTADETMVALREAMEASGQDFHVVYLSNVEQYIDYTPQFRRNLGLLPVSDDGVVVRTLGWGAFGFAPGEEYHYNVQPLPKFTAWLQHSRVKNLPNMLHFRTRTKVEGLSLLDGEVRVSKRPPDIAE